MPRPRPEPRPRDADATRRALLEAATEIFAEHGFAGARVDEVASRAGVNKRMIYAYFGDKEGLYREVLSSHLAAPDASRSMAEAAGPREALEALVRWYFRLLSGDPAFARLLAWDMLSPGPGAGEILLESAAPTLELVADLVRRGVAAGVLRPGLEPEPFRAAVVALCLGYALQRPVIRKSGDRIGRRFSDDEFLDYACGLLFDGGLAAVAPPAPPAARGGSRPRGAARRSRSRSR